MIVSKEFRFEASHQLFNHPGKCRCLHGHSWRLTVFAEGPLNQETGMVVDFIDIKRHVQPLVDQLDHHHLGSGYHMVGSHESDLSGIWIPPSFDLPIDIPRLPTSENLLVWFASNLPSELPWTGLKLEETCTSAAYLTRSDYEGINASKDVEEPVSQEAGNCEASVVPEETEAEIAEGSNE